jgi:hypothetical protein
MWLSRFWRPKFVNPISGALRTAVLVPLFRGGRRAVYWGEEDRERLARWDPQVIAGHLAQLINVEAQPTHALVVLTRPGQSLSAADRDQLWNRFRVPVFQQIIDEGGRLIACECEAHDAMHVMSPVVAQDLGTIRQEVCRCGKQAMLLVSNDRQRTLTVTRSEPVFPPDPVATA